MNEMVIDQMNLDEDYQYEQYLLSLQQQQEELSKCCNAPIRYLDCPECKENDKDCIWICTACGKQV